MPSTACLFGSLLTYFLASPVAYAGTAPLTSAHATYNTLASLTTHAHCVEPAATKITTRLITPIIGTAGSTRALYPPTLWPAPPPSMPPHATPPSTHQGTHHTPAPRPPRLVTNPHTHSAHSGNQEQLPRRITRKIIFPTLALPCLTSTAPPTTYPGHTLQLSYIAKPILFDSKPPYPPRSHAASAGPPRARCPPGAPRTR